MSYKPVTWGDEPVYKNKLNQMAQNEQHLYENMPKLNFNTYGVKRTSGVKIMAAIAIVPGTTSTASAMTFNFGTFFSPGCKPVITTGIQPTQTTRWRNHAVITGISGFAPDHRGFKMFVMANEPSGSTNTIGTTYVHFIAVGW